MNGNGGRQQANSIKSFRRHLEKTSHQKIRNDDAARFWIKCGLSVQWRKSYQKKSW